MCFLSLYSSLFTILLYLFAAILKAGSAIHIQQFCNLMRNICNWKSIFQSNNKKNCNHPPHQSLTSNNNSPSSPAMGLEPTTSGMPSQCLIRSSTRSLIEIHENIPILTHIRLLYKIFAIEDLFFNPDAKYLQLKIYFSIQIQKNCKLVIGI